MIEATVLDINHKAVAQNKRVDRFDIVTGRNLDGKLEHTMHAGTAIPDENGEFYIVRLTLFPTIVYFLKRNREAQDAYTIYSRYMKTADGYKLLNPVGVARLTDALRTHLEMKFHLLERKLFMSLFPK